MPKTLDVTNGYHIMDFNWTQNKAFSIAVSQNRGRVEPNPSLRSHAGLSPSSRTIDSSQNQPARIQS
jgi:hypothetical protein